MLLLLNYAQRKTQQVPKSTTHSTNIKNTITFFTLNKYVSIIIIPKTYSSVITLYYAQIDSFQLYIYTKKKEFQFPFNLFIDFYHFICGFFFQNIFLQHISSPFDAYHTNKQNVSVERILISIYLCLYLCVTL